MSTLQVQQADRMNAEAASALDEEASAQSRAFATEDLREGAARLRGETSAALRRPIGGALAIPTPRIA
jgi:hypothetical protein